MRRRERRAGHAAPGRPPRPTSPLRRRSPRRSRHSRRASACFRRSVPHRPSWTWLRAALHRLDDGAVARPAAGCAAAIDSLVPDVAAASEGCAAPLLGLPPSSWHQRAVASARHSTISTSSRAFSDGLASVARLLYALVALGLAYIRCVENADDLTRHARVSPRWTRRRPGQITRSHEAGTDHGASRRRRAPGSICSSARRSYSIEPNV